MTLTENQQRAINDKSGTLLVAAAAGSGKTSILTKRIISKVTDPECMVDISDFLVVTFTKAAAGELRKRLYDGIYEIVKQHPENARARRQLSLVGLSKISTIHSFCFDIIKKNFEVLNLPSTLKIGEQTELNILKRTTLEEIVSDKYESSDGANLFTKALEIMSSAKSDDGFYDGIIDLFDKLRGLPEPYKRFKLFLESYSEVENSSEIFETTFGNLIRENLEYELGSLLCQLDCLLYEISLDEEMSRLLYDAVSCDMDYYKRISDSLNFGYIGVRDLCNAFKAKTAGRKSKETDTVMLDALKKKRSKINESFKGLVQKYFGADEEILKTAAKESRELLESVLEIILELERKYSEKKLERGLLDYSDLEQYCLRLLVKSTGEFGEPFERTELAKAISNEYAEIYVDEYQDTNSVQDMLFKAISRYDEASGTETNRFLVGDLKQSIYRFRGAEPRIFASYIKSFPFASDGGNDGSTMHKVYLSNNFRCSENVIKFTNSVFETIMSEDYGADERLIYSKPEENKVTAPCELVLIDCPNENPEQYNEEAMYIAKRIREMSYNPLYLNEKGKTYTYSDFAIITRSANAVSEQYRRAFKAMGIPLSSDSPENFFELPEVLLTLCLLNCVDNPQRDIYTAGLMHSPLFGFTPDEMCEIRSVARHTSYFNCCNIFLSKTENEKLRDKVQAFMEKIGLYRSLSRGTPSDSLIFKMFSETGLFDLYSGKTSERRKSIFRIYEMSRSFEKTSFRGLSAFLDYLNDKARGDDEYRPEAKKDSVSLMSIHRSKGLEFPVVFLSRCASGFNTKDENMPIIFSTTHGIGIKLRDTQDTGIVTQKHNFTAINTPFREAIRFCERQDMVAEEKRLLYVAMTRARDRLIVTSLTRDIKGLKIDSEKRAAMGFKTYGRYAMSYLDFFTLSLSESSLSALFKDEEDSSSDGVLKCYRVFMDDDYLKNNAEKCEDSDRSLDSELSERYRDILEVSKATEPYKGALSHVAAKISVSRLKKGLLDDTEPYKEEQELKKVPAFMQEEQAVDAVEKGTALHTFMQFASYEGLEKNGAKAEADRLLEMGFIDKRMYDILDLTALDGFVKSELYKDIKSAKKLFRERRFNLRLSAKEFTENDNKELLDEFILVQGVSDLYYVNAEGGITLVDFKTDNVTEADGEEILKKRHTAQLSYYKRAIHEITGIQVTKVYIYSFSLGREILLDIR